MDSNIIILGLAIAFAVSSAAYLFIKIRSSDLQRQLAAISKDLDMALRCLNNPDQPEIIQGFETNLDEAKRKAAFELYPISGRGSTPQKETIPKRYRHVTTLVDHGLDNSEISAILQISPSEVDQLIKLSQLTYEHAC